MSQVARRAAIVGLFILASLLCFWGIEYGLPHLAHDDEQAFVKRALRFGSGDLNPHFFYYPPLLMYLLFLLYGAYFVAARAVGIYSSVTDFAHSYINDPSAVYLLGRALTALSAVAAVFVVLRAVKQKVSESAGFFAALVLLAFPNFSDGAHIIKSETLLVLLSAVFFGLTADLYEKDRPSDYALAGIVLGLASAAKYNAAILSLVVFFAAGSLYVNRGFADLRRKAAPRLFLFAASALAGFLAANPFAALDFAAFRSHAFQMADFTASGGEFGTGGAPLRYLKFLLYVGGDYPFPGILCGAGFVAAFVYKNKTMILAAVSTAVVYAMCSFLRVQQWHYLIPALPMWAALGGYAADLIRIKMRGDKTAAAVFAGAFVLLLSGPVFKSLSRNYWYTKPDVRVLAKKWIEDNIPEGSKMLIDNRGPAIARSRRLIRKQLDEAERLGHVKKDYFKLQLEAQRGKEYEWYNISRPVIAPPGVAQYSQQVELNVDIAGATARGLAGMGFRYLVLVPPERPTEEEKRFDADMKLLKEFSPAKYVPPLNYRVKIYAIPL